MRTDDEPGVKREDRQLKKGYWAYEASIVIMVTDDPVSEQPFPCLVMGMAPLHEPASRPGDNGITALTSVADAGHPAGWLVADRGYSNAKPENFQLPARALGYKLVLDYREDQLGIQAYHAGAFMIEGAWYCPAITEPLIDATKDFRAGRIDESTWKKRIEARRAFLHRPKAHPDDQGHVRLMCPASPGAPTAGCENKDGSIMAVPTRTRIPVTDELLADPPKVCLQNSVVFPPSEGANFAQPLHYGSDEWQERYSIRNSIEGMNGTVKDGAHSALHDSTRRRVRGVAAQTMFAALLFMATNIRMIQSFQDNAEPDEEGVLRKPRPPRRATKSLTDWRPIATPRGHAPPP